MHDDVTFETRLADALGRLADLSPAMDDEAVAREAITADRSTGRLHWLRGVRRGLPGVLTPGGAGLRIAYLLVVLALVLAAILVAVAVGALRTDPFRPRAGNGRIVFTVQGNDHGPAGTHLMSADGTSDEAMEAGRCPTWSRDGRVLASLSYAGSADLVVAGVDGSPARRVRLVDEPPTSVPYALSPDGTRVAWFKPVASSAAESETPDGSPAITGDRLELWVAPLDGGAGSRIAPAAASPPESFDSLLWSPDGNQIAYESYVSDPVTGERGRSGIWVVGSNGTGLRRLTARPALLGAGMSWSPDGRFLAYAGLADATPVPSSSPDGALAPYPAGDVFVIATDGSGDQALTATPAFEDRPEWSPDGAVLAFRTSADGEAHRLTTVHMNGPTAVGAPVLGPTTDWFVWSPDGTALLWLDVTTLGSEAYRSTFNTIDPDGRRPATTLHVVDGLVVCTPSWQRLEP